MPNLKPYLDAAIAADTKVKSILSDMDAHFTNGTDEGKKKALELRPALDEAKSEAEAANQLYVSMRDASLINDSAAPLFTAPSDTAATSQPTDEGNTPKVITLQAFQALTPEDRLAFAKSGGTLKEE